jgi:hypothetical protein
MSVRHDASHVLWSLTTRSSVIRCEITPLPYGACELHVYQSGELTVREVFQARENAERYAVALHDKLLPLSTDEPVRARRAS